MPRVTLFLFIFVYFLMYKPLIYESWLVICWTIWRSQWDALHCYGNTLIAKPRPRLWEWWAITNVWANWRIWTRTFWIIIFGYIPLEKDNFISTDWLPFLDYSAFVYRKTSHRKSPRLVRGDWPHRLVWNLDYFWTFQFSFGKCQDNHRKPFEAPLFYFDLI